MPATSVPPAAERQPRLAERLGGAAREIRDQALHQPWRQLLHADLDQQIGVRRGTAHRSLAARTLSTIGKPAASRLS